MFFSPWQIEPISMQLLESVTQHGSVMLVQNIAPHVDMVIRVNANNIPVKGSMKDFAQRKSI
jgi:hypothetical protein